MPAHAASQFENVVLNHVYSNDKILPKHGEDGAFELLGHKTTMFPPNILLQNDVEVYKATCQKSLSSPFLEHIMLDSVMIIYLCVCVFVSAKH